MYSHPSLTSVDAIFARMFAEDIDAKIENVTSQMHADGLYLAEVQRIPRLTREEMQLGDECEVRR